MTYEISGGYCVLTFEGGVLKKPNTTNSDRRGTNGHPDHLLYCERATPSTPQVLRTISTELDVRPTLEVGAKGGVEVIVNGQPLYSRPTPAAFPRPTSSSTCSAPSEPRRLARVPTKAFIGLAPGIWSCVNPGSAEGAHLVLAFKMNRE